MAQEKERKDDAFEALVAGVRRSLEGASECALKATPGAVAGESVESVLMNLRLDVSADPKCGEKNTTLSTCTKITTNTSPCDKTKPVSARTAVTLDLQDLVESVRQNVLKEMGLPANAAELSHVSVNLKIELAKVAECGEKVTMLSTCTKITTNTTPCCKTDKNSSTESQLDGHEVTPREIIDLDALTQEVRKRFG